MSVRDNNGASSAVGQSDDGSRNVLPLHVDPITGRLLIEIAAVTEAGGVTPTEPAKRDNNGAVALLGVSDADGKTLLPLIADNRNSKLYVDVLTE